MRRLIIILFFLLPILIFGQGVSSSIKTDKIYSKIGRGISLYDTIFIKKGIAADSLENIQGIICRNASDGRLVYLPFSQFIDSIGGAYISGDTIFVGGDTIVAGVQYWASGTGVIYPLIPADTIKVTGNLRIPHTTAGTGIVYKSASPWLHNFGATGTAGSNTYLGLNAGNFTLTGSDSGVEGSYSVGIGDSALAKITAGALNVAVGYRAMANGRLPAFNQNVAVGYMAMANSDSSNSNVAIGANALEFTEKACNVAVGTGALRYLTSGLDNVAMGTGAMGNNVSGSENISIGVYSLNDHVSGDKNVAIGQYVMWKNVSGIDNTAVGTWAGYENTGNYNVLYGFEAGKNSVTNSLTAIGYQALYQSTAPVVGVGVSAGFNNTSGTGNTYLGNESGYSNATGTNNTYVGSNAGTYFTSANNTAVGYNSMLGANGTSTGARNTALGGLSLLAGTTGNDNTAIGYNALAKVTTSVSNTAVGSGAGSSIVSAGNLTAVGMNSLPNATAAATAVGAYSGNGNTSGTNNVYFGVECGYSNATSSYNSYIGGNAATYNTGGSNTAMGYAALFGNNGTSTGGNNSAFGYQSLYKLTTAANNSAAGYQSLYSTTTGEGNTALGFHSGYTNATGGYNVFLGHRAGYNETGSNKLYIANDSIQPNNMDVIDGLLIFGDFDNRYVNVAEKLSINAAAAGSSLPSQNFSVTGTALISGNTNIGGELTTDNSFGELFENASNVTALAANTYKGIISLQSGENNETTLSDSSILVIQAGTYLINYSSSFTHSVNNTICHISLFVNDTEDTSLEAERKISTGGDYGSMSGTALVTLTANAVLELKAKSDNAGNLTIAHLNFNVIRIQ